MNGFFAKAVVNLDMIGYSTIGFSPDADMDHITNAINKFKDHPSIIRIKEKITIMVKK